MSASPTPRLDAFKKHLLGVRQRLLWVFLAASLGTAGTAWYHVVIIGWLIAPAHGLLSPTGLPIITGVMDAFLFTFHLAILGGILAAAPVAAFHIFQFVKPILPWKAKQFLGLFLPLALVEYVGGVVFSYFYLLPVALAFMLKFAAGVATPYITLDEYMDLAKVLLLWMGVVAELPLLMFMLSKFRIVSAGQFMKLQPYVPVASVLFAMFVSSSFEITIPIALTVLFEVGLVAAWVAGPHPPLSRVIGRWMPWLAWLAAAGLLAAAVRWR